jgi:GT2 family glycosyltransferase
MLTHFFDNLLPSLTRGEDEVVAVIDGCWDARVLKDLKLIEAQSGLVRVLVLPEKVGFGKASNIAARLAEKEVLLFINTDVFPKGNAISVLADIVAGDATIGAAQGLLIYPQTGLVQSSGHVFGDYVNFHAYEGRQVSDSRVQRVHKRQALTAAFYAVRRHVFEQACGFDEFFYNAWEGLELTLRLSQSGMTCLCTPAAIAYHIRSARRRHFTIDETQQIAYFWTKWGGRIANDLVPMLVEQLTDEHRRESYLAINCGSTSTWMRTITDVGLRTGDHIELSDRFEGHICLYDNLSRSVLGHGGPLLLFADHFEQLSANQEWFRARLDQRDLILDLRGNVMTTAESGRQRSLPDA